MSSEADLQKQILQAKWITKRTGQLAEIQTRQLQLWGLITFVNAAVDDIKIYFDWDTRTVTYNVAAPLSKKGKNKNKLVEINNRLNGWVQGLLGDEYSTVVQNKSKIISEGSRKNRHRRRENSELVYMSVDGELTELKNKYPQLTEKELTALRFASSQKMVPVAHTTSESFYQLFIAGRSCQEIQQLNPGFSLAQIVNARILGRWDERLKEQIEKLATDAMALIGQTKLESIRHQADLIRVHHKLYGLKIAKFLQTGEESELTGVPLPAYKTLIQLFNESTAVSKDTAPIQVEVKVTDNSRVVEGTVVQSVGSDILNRMAKKLKNE